MLGQVLKKPHRASPLLFAGRLEACFNSEREPSEPGALEGGAEDRRFTVGCFHRAVCCLVLALTPLGMTLAEQPGINGLPGSSTWQNPPLSWHLEHGSELTIGSGKETDWFVDPFDGTVHSTAPLLLFAPADDYVLNTKVKVHFDSKWDAGAVMVWADDHHWQSYRLNFHRRNSQP
jgi:hypothetical protein